MIKGNLIGFGMFVFAAVFVAIGKFVIGLPDTVVMVIAGVVLVCADMGLRIANRGLERWLMGQRTGGYFFFAPVWIFGCVVIVANVFNALAKLR